MNTTDGTHQPEVVYFDKYDERGAYHWQECDPRASNYNPPLVARYAKVIDEVRKASPVEKLLDIGCGDAYLLAQVHQYCKQAFGVDPEQSAVDLANTILKKHPHCQVVVGNSYELPFGDQTFDMVLLTDVIEHLKAPEACVREIRRVLRPTGTLVLTTPKQRPDRKWDMRHEHEFTADELKNLLAAEFASVEISYFWPLKWSNFYSTKVGWRLCKYIARAGWNPFLGESAADGRGFGQLKAVCKCV